MRSRAVSPSAGSPVYILWSPERAATKPENMTGAVTERFIFRNDSFML